MKIASDIGSGLVFILNDGLKTPRAAGGILPSTNPPLELEGEQEVGSL